MLAWLVVVQLLSAPAWAETAPADDVRCPAGLVLPGVEATHAISIDKVGGYEHYFLRVHIYRLRRAPVPKPDPSKPQDVRYIDFLLAYHRPEEDLAKERAPWLDQLQSLGQIEAEYRCNMRSEVELLLHAPFVDDVDQQLQFNRRVLGLVREATALLTVGEFASFVMPVNLKPSDQIGELLRGELEAMRDGGLPIPSGNGRPASIPEQPALRHRNYYPWIPDLDFGDPAPGEAVFALDRIECANDGNFLIGSIGKIASEPAEVPEGRFAVVREAMIASNAYYGISGRSDDRATVNASVNDEAYWCIPKREFCYQNIDFGDFAIPAKVGEVKEFETTNVVSLRHGLVQAMQRLIMDRCPQT